MNVVSTRRGRFALLEEGDPRAPLVLFLHGFPDSADAWRPVLAAVAARGYRAVAPWMRGYAPSALEGPYDAEALADDVVAIADALGARTFSLVGHDWGAVVSYVLAGRHAARVSSLVTLSVPHPIAFVEDLLRAPAQLRRSWYMAFFQLRGLADRAVPRDDFVFVDRLFRAWSPGLHADRDALDRVKAAIAPGFPAAIEYYRALLWPPGEALDRVRAVARRPIDAPTLHLTGADDGCIGPDVGRAQRRFFRGAFASEVLAGVGHFVQWERPALVAERALAWLNAHPAQAHRERRYG